MANKQKLELTWIGKDERPRLEPRILLEDKERSYHAEHRVSDNDIFDNILIKGDNLLALKALEQEFTGKVKCIYIDPPYNTGSAFEHYDDGLEHSLWLSLIRNRLEILKRLLTQDGSLWVSIDDAEMAYLKIVLDEVFGRNSFVASNVWQKRYSRENREAIGDVHEYILVYAINPEKFKQIRNKIPLTHSQALVYKNSNNDPRGRWRGIPMTAQGYRPNQMYPITSPSGKVHTPPEGRCWSMIEENYKQLLTEGRVYFGKDGNSQPSIIRYLSEVEGGVPWTWWNHEEVGHTDEAKKEMHQLLGRENAFATPKPERLIKRIVEIASNEGDLILDSFAGSGTTGAVAQKMHRRWIMVELGDHAYTHIIPRLKKVIDGEDQGGISKALDWKGGGGFRFYELAPSLLKKDKWDNFIINPEYNAEMLAEAMCKQLGFTYEPSDSIYWMHGHSTESDFICVTTQSLNRETLQAISDEVGDDRTLLICCKAFRAGKTEFHNLTLEKIPNAILSRCEWDKDDYSLQIENLPMKEPESGTQIDLFDAGGDDEQ